MAQPRHLTQGEIETMDKALRKSVKVIPDPRLEAYAAAVEQMLAYEDAGGDGWWKGWDMLKAAHQAAASGA